MEEQRVTIDGVSHDVGSPFLVIATQNPIERGRHLSVARGAVGPLLDEDLSRAPRPGAHGADPCQRRFAPQLARPAAGDAAQAAGEMGQLAASVFVEPSVVDYIARCWSYPRGAGRASGLVDPGGLALMRSRVWAASQGRHFVVPDDVKMLAVPCLAHRLVLDPESEFNGVTAEDVTARVVGSVTPPTERTAEW